jgi:D-alanyl-lipoteichoic acid acyltransferase DltB (MBOAT superfamily)
MCLGFVLPQNFLYPYAAAGFSDFWRRWHITLSTWLRDYLYIPLGGNREGKFKTYINMMITMLIGGLWHGASWTFVAWGGLHGIYLWIEKAIKDNRRKMAPAPQAEGHTVTVAAASFGPDLANNKKLAGFSYALLTFFMICITWVFFRSATFSDAWNLLSSMFGHSGAGAAPLLSTIAIIKVAVITGGMLVCHWTMRNTTVLQVAGKLPWWLVGIIWSILLILIFLSQGTSKSFIYFQF